MVSIILPTYNERENIVPLVEAVCHHVSEPLELLIVDDNSPDRTWEKVQDLEKRFEAVRLIRRSGPKGLTEALNTGLAHAKGEKLLWMDADFSMPPDILPSLLTSLETHPIAIGSRYIEGGRDTRDSFVAVLLSRWYNEWAHRLLKGVRDYTTGFVAIRREVWERLGPFCGQHGDYCVRFLYQARQAGYSIQELPYECRPRRSGHSKTFASPWKAILYGKTYLWTLFSLRQSL